jgi:DNA end-binding protein Ku
MTTDSPARSIRKATISLGLVAVPVKLYTTCESSNDVKFSMLHEADGARLKQQYICTKCNQVVDAEHTVRGHEHAVGKFVVFAPDELDALNGIDDGVLTIREFIRPTALDPVYTSEEKSYYLGPDKGAELAYALVLEAMEDANRIAIGTYSRGGQQRLVALMILHELRYASEVRGVDGVPVPSVTTKPPMLRLAREIVDRMTVEEFVPERYRDTVADRRRELIKRKIENGESITRSPAPTPSNVTDMLEALKASLDVAPARSKRVPSRRTAKARVASVATKKKRKAS